MTIRSIFISAFPGFCGLVLFYALRGLVDFGFSFQIVGSLITALTIATMFSMAFISPRAQALALADSRNNGNLTILSALVTGGTIICIAGYVLEADKHSLITSLSIINFINWIIYITWYSKFKDRANNSILKVGHQLPFFKLENANKQTVSSDTFIGNPAIFIFYRGNWCPLCMAQIKEISEQYQALERRGVKTILVSPQSHSNTESLSKKFNVGFNFLVDKRNTVAKQLNIFDKGSLPFGFQALGYDSDIVMPTVIITDKNGKIVFVDLTDNYRVRPEPETFLKVIDTLS